MKELNDTQVITRIPGRIRARVDQEADRQGLSTSAYIRMKLLEALPAPPERPQEEVCLNG